VLTDHIVGFQPVHSQAGHIIPAFFALADIIPLLHNLIQDIPDPI